MANFDVMQTAFLGGEISPRALGRLDLELYKVGCSALENFLVLPHGGIARRGGTKFISATKYSDKITRVQPMSFRDSYEFMLEFGDLYIRFYRNQAQVTTLYAPWVTANDYIPGTLVTEGGDYYRCLIAHTSGVFATDLTAGKWALTEGDDDIAVEIPSPYTEDEVMDLHFTSNENTLFIVHPLHKPMRLDFVAPWTFTLSDVSYIAFDLVPSTEGTNYVLGEIITVTQAGASGATLRVVAIDTDGGITRLEMVTQGVGYTVDTALATTSSGVGANAKVDCVADSHPGEWGTDNYPSLVWFYEQRFMFAATPESPNAIWGSHSADHFNFTLGTGLDSEGIAIQIKRADKIVWVATTDIIMLGAANGEFLLSAASSDEAMTPANVRPIRATGYGSAQRLTPAIIDANSVFVQRGKRKIRRLQYDLASSKYIARDISIVSEHITTSGIADIAYVNEPDSYIWLLREDGKLVGHTYDPDNGIYAWHRHTIGGTDVMVGSIAASNGQDVHKDELWMVVDRTIDEATVKYIEVLAQGMLAEDDQEDAFFVDSGVTATGGDLAEVTTLSHLEGETVQVLADGVVQSPKVVTGGTITVDPVADTVHVGLPYTSYMDTLPLEGGNPIGSSQGKMKQIQSIMFRLYRSLGLKFGVPGETLDRYYFEPGLMDVGSTLFTGDTEDMPFPGGPDRQCLVRIQQEDPLPLNVLAIMIKASTQV